MQKSNKKSVEFTRIERLNREDEKQTENLQEENLNNLVIDLSIDIEIRINYVNKFYETYGINETIELLNRLGLMYQLSGTVLLREYIYEISIKSNLPPMLKSLCSKTLCMYDDKCELGYKSLIQVLPTLDKKEVGTPLRFELICILLKNIKFKEIGSRIFSDFVDDTEIEDVYRFNCIYSLEKNQEVDKECRLYYTKNAHDRFYKNISNNIRYRLLCAQYLLSVGITEPIKFVYKTAKDKTVQYNVRADATDMILTYGDDQLKEKGRKLIEKLGKIQVDDKKENLPIFNGTIYNNAQNVHTREVEESIGNALEFLQNVEIVKHKDEMITIDYLKKRIEKLAKKAEKNKNQTDKIKNSLKRIEYDRALYSKFACTLTHILLKVWSYASGHKSEDDIKQRLLEELVDMSDTCSTGFATRLVNVISGFGDFNIRISWKDQIKGNLMGRLNAKIRDMDNLSKRDLIMSEIADTTMNYSGRKNFMHFLIENLPTLREELYNEFTDFISDTDFDLWFRAAISMYEMGEN